MEKDKSLLFEHDLAITLEEYLKQRELDKEAQNSLSKSADTFKYVVPKRLGFIAIIHAIETWRKDALCSNARLGQIFFSERHNDKITAKRICKKCPVKDECLEFALSHNETHGIWGGKLPGERRKIVTERIKAKKQKEQD